MRMVGKSMKFGNYDWRVLDVQSGKALLLREKIWDFRPYHRTGGNITWENGTLRTELNNEFCNQIPQAERSRIVTSHVLNSKNPWFGIDGGRDTYDYVFLLSLDEVVKYFGDSGMLRMGVNPAERKNNLTYPAFEVYPWGFHDKYSEARIAKDETGEASWWWLRSPGGDSGDAALVGVGGRVVVDGNNVSSADGGVRPALWLNL